MSGSDPYAMLMHVAQDIKSRNPGMDPQTLAAATSQAIDMMKGLSPDYRALLQNALGYQKLGVQQDIADKRNATNITIRGMADDTSRANTGARVAAQMYGVNARIADADKRLSLTQDRIDARQRTGLADRDTARDQKAGLDGLKAKMAAATAELRAASLAGDPDQIQNAANKVDATSEAIKAYSDAISTNGNKARAPDDAGVPKDLPDPAKLKDGTKAKDDNGKVVAVAKGGKWVKP